MRADQERGRRVRLAGGRLLRIRVALQRRTAWRRRMRPIDATRRRELSGLSGLHLWQLRRADDDMRTDPVELADRQDDDVGRCVDLFRRAGELDEPTLITYRRLIPYARIF